jgi:hypothetical protein
MKATSKNDQLFLAGTMLVVVFGLLSATIEWLAYIIQIVRIFGPPEVRFYFQALEFGFHPATLGFAVCALGGFLGLVYLLKFKHKFVGFSAVFLTGIGLLVPLQVIHMSLPENHVFDLPWIGKFIVLAGYSLMVVGLAAKKSKLQKITLLVLLALLMLYSVYPTFISTNTGPYILGIFNPSVYNVVYAGTLACIIILSITTLAFLEDCNSEKEETTKVKKIVV